MGYKNTKAGIYSIVNIIDGKRYIGQSKNLNKRISEHFRFLKNKKHYNFHLQRAYNKYGESSFTSEILIYCEPFELTRYEQFFVNFFPPSLLYNICMECVDNKKGVVLSEKSKRLMSLHHKDMSGKNNPNFGKDFAGEKNPRTKLTWENINWIREHRREYTYEELSKMFSVSTSALKYICLGKSWKDNSYHFTPIKRNQTGENNGNAILTFENVSWIRKHRKEYTIKELGKMFGVSKSTISNICLNISWKNKEN